MVQVDGKYLDITQELQEFLSQNPAKKVNKAVIARKKDDKGDLVHQLDSDGEPMYVEAVQDVYPFVYFDANGKYYLNVFRTAVVYGREIIITNPKLETKKDCTLYGKGVLSHYQDIPGSELWDNGRTDLVKHREAVCKGDPTTKIVKVLSREDVLEVDVKPTGDNLVAKIANLSPAEKEVVLKQLGLSQPKARPDIDDEE